MSPNSAVSKKQRQQYEIAEMQKRLLISELYNLIEELENRPRIQMHHPFPYNGLARGINSVLDWIEIKYLQKFWARHQRRITA